MRKRPSPDPNPPGPLHALDSRLRQPIANVAAAAPPRNRQEPRRESPVTLLSMRPCV